MLAARLLNITRVDDMHRDIARAFDFPDYYGHNLDALRDCMRDVTDGEYGWDTGSAGLVVVYRRDVAGSESGRGRPSALTGPTSMQ